MQAASQMVKFHCFFHYSPVPHKFLLSVSLSHYLDVLMFSLCTGWPFSLCLPLSIHPDLFTLPHLTFPLFFSLVFSSLIPLALSYFCSCWRTIMWEATHADTQRRTNRVEEIEGRNRHGPSCIWVSPEGPCQLPLTILLFRLCTGVSSYVGLLCLWLCVSSGSRLVSCKRLTDFQNCAGCRAGAGLVNFTLTHLDLA